MKRLNRCFNFKFPKLQNLNLSCNCISRDVIKVKLNLHECIETRVHWFDDLTSLWFLKGHVFFSTIYHAERSWKIFPVVAS